MVTWEETQIFLRITLLPEREGEGRRAEEKLILEGSKEICNKGISFYSVTKIFSIKVKDFVKFHISTL